MRGVCVWGGGGGGGAQVGGRGAGRGRRFGKDLRECRDDIGRGLLGGEGKVHYTCSESNPRQSCAWLPGPALHQESRIQTISPAAAAWGHPPQYCLFAVY